MKSLVLVSGALLACGGTQPAQQPPPPQPKTCRNSESPAGCIPPSEPGLGSHQGVWLEGLGVERVHFSAQGTGGISFPAGGVVIPPGTSITLTPEVTCGDSKSPTVTLKACAPIKDVEGAIGCQADIDGIAGICTSTNFRGDVQDIDPEHGRGVLVVRGLWDATAAWHDQPNVVTLSCDASLNPVKNAQFRAGDGSITHCIRDIHLDPATQQEAFLACIRMARADYCGDGIAHTFTGTEIRVSTPENPTLKTECTDGKCFEASWSKDGAVCIQHVRYDGPNAGFDNCKDQFKISGRLLCRAPAEQGIVVSHSRPRTCGKPIPGTCTFDADPVCAIP
jgi:hypothetical protein